MSHLGGGGPHQRLQETVFLTWMSQQNRTICATVGMS